MGSGRAQETIRVLRENITSGRWPVNSRIPTEAELMAELGVGRSTVREAVRSLANLGMLEPARSRGTFVRSRNPVSAVLADFVTAHTIEDMLVVRRALEVEACQLAAAQRSEDDLARLRAAHERDVTGESSEQVERGTTPGHFHALIFEAGRNRLLTDLYAGIMTSLRQSIREGKVAPGSDETERQHDHEALLAAIEAKDVIAAAHRAAEHADRDLVVTTPVPAP